MGSLFPPGMEVPTSLPSQFALVGDLSAAGVQHHFTPVPPLPPCRADLQNGPVIIGIMVSIFGCGALLVRAVRLCKGES
jgi:hypothetical protein